MKKYEIEQAWWLNLPQATEMIIYWPWLVGYAGEGPPYFLGVGSLFARIGVDGELKKSLGY